MSKQMSNLTEKTPNFILGGGPCHWHRTHTTTVLFCLINQRTWIFFFNCLIHGTATNFLKIFNLFIVFSIEIKVHVVF